MEWADRLRRSRPLEVEVGYPEDVVGDFVDVVRINFLGSSDGKHPPPRPLLDEAWAAVERQVADLGIGLAYLESEQAGKARLEEAGRILEAKVREILEARTLQENAPATIARKGVNAPLRTPGGDDRFMRLLTRRLVAPGDE